MSEDTKASKKEYHFGGLREFNLEEIESEVLNDSVYLDVFAGSDRVFKQDLKSIEGALAKLQQLDGLTYLYKTQEFPEYQFPEARQIGFVAQAVEKVFPELVKKDQKGHLAVNYAQLTPVLVEGIKQLSNELETQREEMRQLRAMVETLVAASRISSEDETTQL